MPTSLVSTPCDASDSSRSRPRSSTSALSIACTGVTDSIDFAGSFQLPRWAAGPRANSSPFVATAAGSRSGVGSATGFFAAGALRAGFG
ncbi:unannotated protein [freshwater metagenome]|uniref:Unannotated protein n=1 Tax=freshwater metagenome TaxID=449393 RepID=A0A6J7RU60_9ZZZZ